MAQEKIHDLILQLKQIRKERGLSYQDIMDLVKQSGGYISLSAVRRVFAEDSENKGFRYEDSIKPLVIALLDMNKPPEHGDDVSLVQHEIDTLRVVISIKEEINQDLRAENNRLVAEAADKQSQITALIAQNTTSQQQNAHKDRAILGLSAGLISVLVFICAVLVYDISNLSTGFVRVFTGVVPIAIVGIIAIIACIIVIYFIVRKRR